jgi:hypothetical protein
MNLTVNQLLEVVGRLDDNQGFDTARERFRRFLNERITDPASARSVIAECRQLSGEQHSRGLQDAVVLTGKLLGLDTSYGPYQHDAGVAPVNGEWLSRHRLHVLLLICGPQTNTSHLEPFSNAVRSTDASPHPSGTARVGLCVLTPLCSAKARIEDAIRRHAYPGVRLISLDGILHLADLVGAARLTREDVLRVLNPAATVDSLIEIIERRPAAASVSVVPLQQMPVPEESAGHRCWVAAIRLPHDTPPARLSTRSLQSEGSSR